jgi:hypothetical protein
MNELLDRWANDDDDDDAMHGFFEILEENDYDFMAIATSVSPDPRFLALDSEEFRTATDRLSEYRGYDVDPPQTPDPERSGRSGAPVGLINGALTDDFPEKLIPSIP